MYFQRLIRIALTAAIAAVAFAGLATTASAKGGVGYVYSSTNMNGPDGNSAVVFKRSADGALEFVRTVPTDGLGLGSGLGSQGAVTLSENNQWLFVVNAGSDEISVFGVKGGDLTLVDVEPSGGDRPVSVTIHHELVYVLNQGAGANISGFTFHNGNLTPLANSTRPLSADGTVGSQVQFTPDGKVLVATERGINSITTWTVGKDGRPGTGLTQASNGAAPFGFDFDNEGHLIVSEAGQRALSSYDVASNGNISVISASEPTNLVAACWVVVSKNGKFAYTTNAGSAAISGYSIAHDGTLTLLDADGITGATGADTNPTDVAISNNGQLLYALSNRTNSIVAFEVHADGSLTVAPGVVNPFMGGAAGIAAN